MGLVTLIKKFVLVVFAVASAGLLVSMAAARTEITYTDLFNPFGVPNSLDVPLIGQFLSPGKVVCPGYTPTGDPMQPCPQGSMVLFRGTQFLTRVDSKSTSLAGWMTVDANTNFAPDYTGPAWGRFSIQLDAGGTLEGTWNGFRRKSGESVWVTELGIIGHGLGGDVAGKQAKCVEVITELTPTGIFYKGVGTCRILDENDE